MKTVYVALSHVLQNGMPVLDSVFDTFQHDKTKIILTFVDGHEHIQDFMDLAERHYRARCKEKKFEAEIVAPLPSKDTLTREDHLRTSVVDLIKRCGMKYFVLDAKWRSVVSYMFDEMRDGYLSCKIWLVHDDAGRKLIFQRTYGFDPDLEKVTLEAEDFKKKAHEETIKCEALEQKVLSMTEEIKKNKQNIKDTEELFEKEKKEKNSLTLEFEDFRKKAKEEKDALTLKHEGLLKNEKDEKNSLKLRHEDRLKKEKEEKNTLLLKFYLLLCVCGVVTGVLSGVVIMLMRR